MNKEKCLLQEIAVDVVTNKQKIEAIHSRGRAYKKQDQARRVRLYEAMAAAVDPDKQDEEHQAALDVLLFDLLAANLPTAAEYFKKNIEFAEGRLQAVKNLNDIRNTYENQKKRLFDHLDEKRYYSDMAERNVGLERDRYLDQVKIIDARFDLKALQRMADELEEAEDFAEFCKVYREKEEALDLAG